MATLVAGNSDFVFDLYRELVASDSNLSGSNLFFSPHSISLALAMAYAGATGQTMEQMSETLNFALPLDRLHPAFNTLDLALASGSAGNSNEDFRLNVANSVWGQADHGFLIEFLDVLAESYGEMVREVDFKRDSEGARILINDWVAGGDRRPYQGPHSAQRHRPLHPTGARQRNLLQRCLAVPFR